MTLAAVPSSWAADLLLRGNNGWLSVDGGATFSSQVVFNGSIIRAGGVGDDGIREYFVLGDLNVGAADRVRPLWGTDFGVRFVVGNNANLRGTFDFAGNTAGTVGLPVAGGAWGGAAAALNGPAALANNPSPRANAGLWGRGGSARVARFVNFAILGEPDWANFAWGENNNQ